MRRTVALLFGLAPLMAPASAITQVCLGLEGIDDRCESWVGVYDNPDGHAGRVGSDRAFAMAVSPAGDRVFTAGWSFEDASDSNDIKALAFDATTGALAWAARIDGEGHGDDWGSAIGVSTDGGLVFLAGYLAGERPGTSEDGPRLTVAALDSSDGAQRWTAGVAGDRSVASALAVSGDTLFVAGSIADEGEPSDLLTLAYDASTGQELWRARYAGPGGGYDAALAIAAGPDGKTLFVTGYQDYRPGDGSTLRPATVAYDAEDGAELWTSDSDSILGRPADLAVSPDGTQLFLAGSGGGDYAVVAHAAETGERLWDLTYTGTEPGNDQLDSAEAVGVSPDGRLVYVTGTSSSEKPEYLDYATLAIDAGTGATVWEARYAGPGHIWEFATDLAVAPERVYVTGWSAPNYGWMRGGGSDGSVQASEHTFASAATVAYDAATGTQLWAARFNSSPAALDADYPAALVLSPDGRRAYVGGTFVHTAAIREPGLVENMNFADVGVLAYDTGP